MAKKPNTKRRRRMKTGKGWRLTNLKGGKPLKAALLRKLRVGKERLAIFRVIS
jgi:hypothetical protein